MFKAPLWSFFLYVNQNEFQVKAKWNNLSPHLNTIFCEAPLLWQNLMVFDVRKFSIHAYRYSGLLTKGKESATQI